MHKDTYVNFDVLTASFDLLITLVLILHAELAHSLVVGVALEEETEVPRLEDQLVVELTILKLLPGQSDHPPVSIPLDNQVNCVETLIFLNQIISNIKSCLDKKMCLELNKNKVDDLHLSI